MPTGTSIVVMTRPATMSCRSQDGWYWRSVRTPGTQRIQPVRACVRAGDTASAALSVEGASVIGAGSDTRVAACDWQLMRRY